MRDEDLRVPVERLAVELVTSRGRRAGTLFVPTDTTLEAVLEDEEPFFPIEQGGRIVLQARADVVRVVVDSGARSRGSLADAGVAYAPRAVCVRLSNGDDVVGDLLVVADGARRTLDVFNDPAKSIAIHEGGRMHVVAKKHVREIVELG